MMPLLLLATLASVPQQVLIATPRGQVSVPVVNDHGVAALAGVLLAQPLGVSLSLDGSTLRVTLNDQSFEFDLGSPFVRYAGVAYPLVGAPYVARDTIFLPLQWLTGHVPRLLGSRYHWDPWLSRLDEVPAAAAGAAPVVTRGPTIPPASTPNPNTGLRLAHTVVVDPGHGGVDPGNPGMHFPRGLTEKDITLGIGRLLRTELQRRGLTVVLTRATDTLIDLANRPTFCRADCDLFVSIHINSMPAGRRQTQVNGV